MRPALEHRCHHSQASPRDSVSRRKLLAEVAPLFLIRFLRRNISTSTRPAPKSSNVTIDPGRCEGLRRRSECGRTAWRRLAAGSYIIAEYLRTTFNRMDAARTAKPMPRAERSVYLCRTGNYCRCCARSCQTTYAVCGPMKTALPNRYSSNSRQKWWSARWISRSASSAPASG